MRKHIIFDDMTQCTETDVERLKALASKQRLEQAMRYKHLFGQWACLKSYEMLLQLLNTGKEIEFEYNEYGKPRLTEEWAERMQTPFRFFSISHCKEGIAVAVSEHETGIDIESRTRRISDGLAERVMNEQEQYHIATHPNPQTAFIELWTKKEAVLKLRGTGIIDDMRDVLTGNEHIETYVYDTYIVSIASVWSQDTIGTGGR